MADELPVIDLDPQAPAFVRDPYPLYATMRDLGRLVVWRQLGHRCVARYDDVNALLRDRRFGRQILHVATREELGWPPGRTTWWRSIRPAAIAGSKTGRSSRRSSFLP